MSEQNLARDFVKLAGNGLIQVLKTWLGKTQDLPPIAVISETE
ncbi:hypothetical protein AB6D04_14245 [Vibrio splendidus]